ncbi:MAG TPA: AraC family transcriptional regulator [Chitinophaga sp.]|uniref:AraC family transcriptional regulator n=1 Tax=Chitinophaga sp. TaxID=1869181 RepID=UPI002C7C6CCB|nr:AraC family transcriptional regulator [Chitinophaga sp.]HVI44490.1 AraC family transcriptional regulator [Chitinophaga sp.]
MKAILKKVSTPPECSFTVRRDIGERMLNIWHYHPELELLYIRKSSGTWLIGDYIGPFQGGDIVLIGAHLPHSFQHEDIYINATSETPGEAIVALFNEEITGIATLPEMKKVQQLLQLSKRGIRTGNSISSQVAAIMEEMPAQAPGQRLLTLYHILYLIAESGDYEMLSSEGFHYKPLPGDSQRLKVLIEHMHKHFLNKPSLEDAAAMVHMTPTAFCRYFKNKTGKTFVGFLTQLRIAYACQLLINTDNTITEICYECGYNTLSHFINMFKLITGKKPLEYKNYFR